MSLATRLKLGAIAVVGALVLLAVSMVRIVDAPDPPMDKAERARPPERAATAGTGELIVPVQGVARSALRRDWGDARGAGVRAHQGLDIMAPGGTPVIAAAPGRVEKLFYSKGGGGISLYQRSQDRRWSYYYAHLAGYAPGVHEGQLLEAGDPIGFVGDTGNAGAGNFHLHFGISRMRPEERWHQGEPVDPYPLLTASE